MMTGKSESEISTNIVNSLYFLQFQEHKKLETNFDAWPINIRENLNRVHVTAEKFRLFIYDHAQLNDNWQIDHFVRPNRTLITCHIRKTSAVFFNQQYIFSKR